MCRDPGGEDLWGHTWVTLSTLGETAHVVLEGMGTEPAWKASGWGNLGWAPLSCPHPSRRTVYRTAYRRSPGPAPARPRYACCPGWKRTSGLPGSCGAGAGP